MRVPVIRGQVDAPGTSEDHFPLAFVAHVVEVFIDEDLRGGVVSDGIPLQKSLIENRLELLIVSEDPRNYERLWRKMFGEPRGWRYHQRRPTRSGRSVSGPCA